MKVRELIQALSKIEDQDAIVMTSGYEGGFCDIENLNLRPVDMALNVNTEWYYGAHERINDVYHEDREKYQVVKAVII
jgi:hypothetical protein